MLMNHNLISEGLVILTIYLYYNDITFYNIYEKIKNYFTFKFYFPNLNDSLDPNIIVNDYIDSNDLDDSNKIDE